MGVDRYDIDIDVSVMGVMYKWFMYIYIHSTYNTL